MTRKQKRLLIRILLAAALLLALHFVPVTGISRLFLYLIPYLVIGYDLLRKAALGILHGQVLDENFLMAAATLGALVIGVTHTGDYAEAVAVMLFFQIGELFESYAVGKSRKNIAALMDIRPDYANVLQDGNWVQADPETVPVGSVITLRPGERVPLDGIVLDGSSTLDTGALTGESLPWEITVGDEIISGCINLSGVLTVRTTKEYHQSTVAKILDLVENASSRKSRSEHFVTKFARYYTPTVCISALFVAILPPLVNILLGEDAMFATWVYRALSFLVASCPCALVISIPLSFFAGIGGTGKAGILIKGSNYLEALSKVDTVVFDKTGTLTQGSFEVIDIHPVDTDVDTLLEYAALAESASSHPIAKCLRKRYGRSMDPGRVTDIQELGGFGITARIDGISIAAGNAKLMAQLGISHQEPSLPGTVIHIAAAGRYTGYILLADTLKPGASAAMDALKKAGIRHTVMLTGDNTATAQHIARQLGIDQVHSQLLPGDKVTQVETLLAGRSGGKLAFVGDGINDAPVLSRADIGIAMGAMGSDAAIEAADIVLMDDDPRKIATAIRISRKCMGIVRQNLVFAISVKILALILVALGAANMWLAIFADVGIMVLCVLNAIRAIFVKKT